MQTLSAVAAPEVEAGRPAYRPFLVRVSRVERLTPSFRQVTFLPSRSCASSAMTGWTSGSS
jgi:NADPH-dependent ferric siderophore reductase